MGCLLPRPSRAVLAVLFSVLVQSALAAETESVVAVPVIYVKAGHLFDATSDDLRDNVVLVIEGERIMLPLSADGHNGDGVLGATDYPSRAMEGPVELLLGQIEWFSI